MLATSWYCCLGRYCLYASPVERRSAREAAPLSNSEWLCCSYLHQKILRRTPGWVAPAPIYYGPPAVLIDAFPPPQTSSAMAASQTEQEGARDQLIPTKLCQRDRLSRSGGKSSSALSWRHLKGDSWPDC